MEIISKRSGPREEDEKVRRLIAANQPTIAKLADRLTNGAWSAARQSKASPEPARKGLLLHTSRAAVRPDAPRPFVRVAYNGRVSLVDLDTGMQLHHLGDLRRRDGSQSFRLATRDNGFFSPVDPEIAGALADLDGQPVEDAEAERRLIGAIGDRLHI